VSDALAISLMLAQPVGVAIPRAGNTLFPQTQAKAGHVVRQGPQDDVMEIASDHVGRNGFGIKETHGIPWRPVTNHPVSISEPQPDIVASVIQLEPAMASGNEQPVIHGIVDDSLDGRFDATEIEYHSLVI
jgi:hypothetical protein